MGRRQIFVRFAHCHLKCAYCDTAMTSPDGRCHVESQPGAGHAHSLENPVSAEALMATLARLAGQMRHHSVSFTGGEPLLYHRFLTALFPRVQKELGLKTYLETSGTQPSFLAPLLAATDIIAMDIKLPSATREAPQFEQHASFYQLARSRPEVELFVKLIFNQDTTEDELAAVRDIVFDRSTPIVLQPETALTGPLSVKADAQAITRVETFLARHFDDVRVIPQTHKMLRVL